MKIKSFTCNCVLVICFIILFSSYGFGGGPGNYHEVIAAPYSGIHELTIDRVREMKAQSNRHRCIESGAFPIKDDVVKHCHSVGFRFEGENKFFYYLEGEGLNNNYPYRIYFGDIESIELIEKRYQYVVLKVVIFPTISLADLINRKPSYGDLISKFKRTVEIRSKVYADSYGYLSLVCVEDNYNHTVISKLKDFPENVKVTFSYDIRKDSPIWWATEEVIQDKDYPFRRMEYAAPTTGIE